MNLAFKGQERVLSSQEKETMVDGNKFIVGDAGLCIGCRTCMAACFDKHDIVGDVAIPRLNVVSTLKVSTPIACRHCQDAPCARACPVNALYHEDDGRVAMREDRCIGCRSCMMACPYGAIQIVGRPENVYTGCADELFIGEAGNPYIVKCDLCHDREDGPACVGACLTGALHVQDNVSFDTSRKTKWAEAAEAAGALSSVPLNPVLA